MTDSIALRRWFLLFLLPALAVMPFAAHAQSEDLDREFEFASGLIEWRFSDYALKLAEQLERSNPALKDRVSMIKAQSFIAARKFSQAEEILKDLGTGTKADAVRLALANGYYAYGDIDKSRQIYQEFFGRFTQKPDDQDLLRFYQDAAFRYAIMLERAGDAEGAIQSYERVLRTDPEKDIARRIQYNIADLLVRAARENPAKKNDFLNRAQAICEELQWGGVDIWFGNSISTMAHIELARGNEQKARELLQDYDDILKQIDEILKEQGMSLADSPMAGTRFLLGELFEKQAKQLASENKKDEAVGAYGKALGEYYNVFVKYGESDFGPDAGVRAKNIKSILESEYGKTVKIDLGDQAEKAAETQFRLADNLFREKKYQEAVNEYLRTLNQYPETERSVKALGSLMRCYEELGQTFMVRTIGSYIANRFSKSDVGAAAILSIGKIYIDKNQPRVATELYEMYLSGYPEHEKAGTILYFLAALRKQAGDEASAAEYYRRIIDNYPNDSYYPRALNQVAWSYYTAENYAEAIKYFEKQIKEITPGPDRAAAQFNLADCYIREENFTKAAAELQTLIGWLSNEREKYGTTPSDRDKNDELLEKAVFQIASCLARISEPASAVPGLREKAISAFDQFVTRYPKSELASRALSGKGRVQLELKRFDAATATFDELAAKYPDSPEGKNALFSLARSAMEIGQYDQAVDAFNKMMANASQYSPQEFLRIGQLMGDAGYAEQAIQAYNQVPADAERALLERALYGIGKAYYDAGQFQESIAAFLDLLEKYPRSALFYEARFKLGEAYREAGMYHEAVESLSEVFRFATDQELIDRATLTLAAVQRANGELSEALASYQRIALLSDASKPENRDKIETSILASIDIARELGRWDVVVDSCDQYIENFPQGEQISQVREWKGEAQLKAISTPAPEPAPGGSES